MPDTQTDAVVVGGGLAGLTAATHLANAGRTVTLLEARAALGGRATSEVRNGYIFNQGAHALYDGGPGVEVLHELGITPTGSAPPLAGMGAVDDRLSPLPYGPVSLFRSRLLGVGGKVALAKLMAFLGRVDAAAVDGVPVSEWVEGSSRRDDVRRLLRALVRLATYADAPDLLSAGAAVRQLQSVIASGVLYLDNGWQQLVDALRDRAASAGVVIGSDAKVDHIEPAGEDRTIGVGHSGGTAGGRAVILATGGPDAAERLLGLKTGSFAAGPPIEAAVLDVSLWKPPTHRFVLGIDRPVYFSVHGPPAALAPEGGSAAVAMRYIAPGADVDAHALRSELDAVVSEAGAVDPVDQRFLFKMTVTHGIPLASQGGFAGRPPVAVPGRPGVYVAGDWVGDTALLGECALASGRTAAVQADQHLAGASGGAGRPT